MKADLEVDVLKMFNEFKELTGYEMDAAVRRALRKAANEIKKKTVENARSDIKTYNNHPDDPYQGDSILDAPRVTKVNDWYDEDELSIEVHVLGSKAEDSQTYRFRFLEKGTKDRYQRQISGKDLKKARYIGRIAPRRYFGRANQETNVEQIYVSEINKAIEKINNGKA